MQDVSNIRNFFSKLAAVTNPQESTESLKLLHGNRSTPRLGALQEVLVVVGRKEEEQSGRRFEMKDFGVGLPPLASSY